LHDGIEAFPKFVAVHAGVGQHFGFDEFVQVGGNLQATDLRALGGVVAHGEVSLDKSKTENQDESYWIAWGGLHRQLLGCRDKLVGNRGRVFYFSATSKCP
jgi:hypothetical protein